MRHLRRTAFGLACGAAALAAALAGCASRGVAQRRAKDAAGYAALPAEQRRLVDRGEIGQGMSTNAVFLALGAPSEVSRSGSGDQERLSWRYYRNGVKETPYWLWLPTANGYNTYELYFDHTAHRYLAMVVMFESNRVVGWERYRPPVD